MPVDNGAAVPGNQMGKYLKANSATPVYIPMPGTINLAYVSVAPALHLQFFLKGACPPPLKRWPFGLRKEIIADLVAGEEVGIAYFPASGRKSIAIQLWTEAVDVTLRVGSIRFAGASDQFGIDTPAVMPIAVTEGEKVTTGAPAYATRFKVCPDADYLIIYATSAGNQTATIQLQVAAYD